MNSIIKNIPFHLQVYEIIRDQIISGQRKPSERLLEQKIAEELGVSRSPVREALRMIEQEGLLINSEQGLIVYPIKLKDIEEVYQCRAATEPFAAFLAAENLANEDFVEIESYVDQAELAYQNGEFQKVVEYNTNFHDLILKGSHNKRLEEIVERLRSLILLSRNTELRTYSRPRDYLQEHRDIICCLKKRDKYNVQTLVRDHIENDWLYFQKNFLKS